MSAFRKSGRGSVDGTKVINFSFDGKLYQGLQGDTLASALLANGVHLMGRSFKYHRPRGVIGAGSEEPNAIVAFDRGEGRVTPNVRATSLELFEGLKAVSQNRSPNLKFDIGAFNNVFSRFFPAGFYNKTFLWPKSFWDKIYEPFIRNMAGLGPAPTVDDPDNYASSYGHCETLIIGAGPAGLAAALAASKKEGRVILVDERAALGGSLHCAPAVKIDGMEAKAWIAKTLKTLTKADNVTLMPRTTAIGYWHNNFVALSERITDHLPNIPVGPVREELHRIRAGHVILAQGGIERPLVFNGNDRPGIMLASAAQSYLHNYGVAIGHEVAFFTSHDSAYQTAFDLADANIRIPAIIDLRETLRADLIEGCSKRGIDLVLGSSISKTSGKLRLTEIEIYTPSTRAKRAIKCDALAMSGGWTAGGGRKVYKTTEAAFGTGVVLNSLPNYIDGSKQKAFVDFQNDVTEKDINLAVQEGFKSIEHVKRYTTNGMATDQGKTSNLNALEIASKAVGKPIEKVGLTTFRPPYTPTTFGAFIGYRDKELFDPIRKTPIDGWAEARGAVYEPVAHWRRAWYFPKQGEDMHQAVARECKATRDSLGIFDASTLGKIEVVGPDATKFMNLMYSTSWTSLKPGGCRYGLMLREDGYIYDDGVVATD